MTGPPDESAQARPPDEETPGDPLNEAALQISHLLPSERRPGWVLVKVGGEVALRLPVAVVQDQGLEVGRPLTPELRQRLLAAGERERARGRALRFLQTRERSREEVARRLRRYDYDEALVGDVLAWLDRLGYVDDRRFAALFAREKARAGLGRRRVQAELRRAGVTEEVAETALDEAFEPPEGSDPGAGEERLLATLRRRFGREYQTDPARAQRRAGQFLLRRGYDWQEAGRLLAGLRESIAETAECAGEAGEAR